MLTTLGVILGSLLAVALVLLIARERLRAPGARRSRDAGGGTDGTRPSHDGGDGPGGSDGGDGGGGGD
ncbi:hypothetical protein LDO32_06585 [Luteimonas sp. Y-2-2-4F]|nr:hypothetical protein [Luteimonas sp. Y-2-2-4F]MCD9031393.1 hypothetical protein [Luteimonas sp. Y-2-2-4F]